MTTNEGRGRGQRPVLVCFGFLALDPALEVSGCEWCCQTQHLFRLGMIAMWGAAEVESVSLCGENQITQATPSKIFEPEISPAYVAANFFDPPLVEPFSRLIGRPMVERFELAGMGFRQFRTLVPGDQLSVSFVGKLRALLLIGDAIL